MANDVRRLRDAKKDSVKALQGNRSPVRHRAKGAGRAASKRTTGIAKVGIPALEMCCRCGRIVPRKDCEFLQSFNGVRWLGKCCSTPAPAAREWSKPVEVTGHNGKLN